MQFMTLAHLFTSGVLIAVVVLLICIVLQLRQANRIRGGQMIAGLREQFMKLQTTIASNEDLAQLYQRGLRGFTGLSDTEQTRFFVISGYAFTHWSEIQRYANSGLVPQSYWDEAKNQLRDFVQYPGVQEFWGFRKHWYTPEFQALVTDLIKDAPKQVKPLYPEPVV